MKFTSYIRDLHPSRHATIDRTIEQHIESSLPLWNQCLAMATGYQERKGAGRMESHMGPPYDAGKV